MILLDELKQEIPELEKSVAEAADALGTETLKEELAKLDEQTMQPGFWENQETAQKVMKSKKSIENKLGELDRLASSLEDLKIMIEMAEEADDEETAQEAKAEKEILKAIHKSGLSLDDVKGKLGV